MDLLRFSRQVYEEKNLAHYLVRSGDDDALAMLGAEINCNGVFAKRQYTLADIQDIGYLIGRQAARYSHVSVAIEETLVSVHPDSVWVTWLSFGMAMAEYHYHHIDDYHITPLVTQFVLDSSDPELKQATRYGLVLARAQACSRELMNKPSNILYPETFVQAVAGLSIPDVTLSVMEQPELATAGFGGLVGVAQGSDREARLLTLDYHPDNATHTIVLVGKGVTFDSGGISIKQARMMSTMKFDMGGAAAVVGTLQAVAELALPIRVIGLCGLVENMPSGKALRPGDVVTMLSGTSVEIISTDAEGRMVLADVLHYAQQTYQPDFLVDIATLTGGAGVALGKGFSALMGNDHGLMQEARKAGDVVGEPVWPMPTGGWFETALQSDYADLQHGSEDPHGSPCVAATFLRHFVAPDQKWIHIDSAAMSHAMPHRKMYEKGATGYGVLLLVSLCQCLSDEDEQ